MICSDPFVKAGEAYPCGKCLPCLKRRRQLWVHRLMLEKFTHRDCAVVTLTYADENLPAGGSLHPVDLQLFLKRLRRKMEPKKLRFYGVGEYGDKSQRPHYHVLLFGYPNCVRGRSFYSETRTSCCSSCDLIAKTWGLGNVLLDGVSTKACGYICGYITKNMRRTDDKRLNGRWPEFCRMSLNPGIGFPALDQLSQDMLEWRLDERLEDVPTTLQHGGAHKPLGRYLRGKLRSMLYGPDKKAVVQDTEMLAMWLRAVEATPKGGEVRRNYFKNLLLDHADQPIRNMEVRASIKPLKIGVTL